MPMAPDLGVIFLVVFLVVFLDESFGASDFLLLLSSALFSVSSEESDIRSLMPRCQAAAVDIEIMTREIRSK